MSAVWKYFKRLQHDRENAICNICNRVMQCKRSCTSGLKKHLLNIHKIELPSFNNTVSKRPSSSPEVKAIPVKCDQNDVIGMEDVDLEYEDFQAVYEELEILGDDYGDIIEEIEEKPVLTNPAMKLKKSTFIWNYFKRTSEITATCLQCNKTVMCRDNHFKGLMKHYNSHILLQCDKVTDDGDKTQIKQDSDCKTIAKLFATDSISISTLSSSEFFQALFPSQDEIKEMIKHFYTHSKSQTVSKISEILESNKDTRFSLTLDNSLGARYVFLYQM